MKHLKIILCTMICFFLYQGRAQEYSNIEKQYLREIKQLNKQKKVKEAYAIIDKNDPRTMEDLVELTEVIAPPFMEQERAALFKEKLQAAGADTVYIDKAGNVIARRKGKEGKRTVALDAHLDVVFPEGTDVTVRMVGDTLKAPGIGDDTRGLSMVISVLKAMNEADIETSDDLLFIGSVGEEGLGDLRGLKHLFNESELKIDSWISIDGGDLGRITNAALGSKRYKVVLHGKGGHSWGAFGLANPHHALGKVIDRFTQEATPFTQDGPKTSFNIGRIGGGTSVNSIPFESWMEVDMRSVSAERLDQIEVIFKEAVQGALSDYNKGFKENQITLDLQKIGDRPSGELPANLPLIQRAMAATQLFGATPDLSRGSTNASIPIAKGIPAICIGRGGSGGGAHSLHEWFVNENGAEAIKLALLITLAESGMAR